MTVGSRMTENLKFIADHNVGKLAQWLRIMGYDTVFFNGEDDASMITIALDEGRVILTRDTEIMKRRVVSQGRLKAVLIESDDLETQLRQLIASLNLNCHYRPFTLCLVCNQPLLARTKEEVQDRVPPYVFLTQRQYMECPACHRIYWRGTHWQAMLRRLENIFQG